MTCLEAIYETKYDGFRCLAFSSGDKIDLQSKKQKSRKCGLLQISLLNQ
jgi:hypothetical protein